MERPHCPKCGYSRQPADTAPSGECPRCGIVFAKYAQHLAERAQGRARPEFTADDDLTTTDGWLERLREACLPTPTAADRSKLVGEALVMLLLVVWGGWFISRDWRDGEAGGSFLHNVDLAFHEFGHLLFRPLGEWLMFLGGSLFQCLVPLILLVVFLWKERQPFSAAACLWWTGQNLIDLAPYIGDARAMALPLVGEWNEEMVEFRALRHDWHNILEPLGLLGWDGRLAGLAHWSGALLMLLAWLWMGAWLLSCHRAGEDGAD